MLGPHRMLRLLLLMAALLAPLWAAVLRSTGESGTWDALSNWVRQQQRGARLDDELLMLCRSMKVTDAITADLAEGRLSLREAAAALLAELENRPATCRLSLDDYPGRSLEERSRHWAIARVEIRMGRDARRAAVVGRLRAEVQEQPDGRRDPSSERIGPSHEDDTTD
jgi:hypothetical protein